MTERFAALIDELQLAIAGIHPSTDHTMLRESRRAMCHALEFIQEVQKAAQSIPPRRRSGASALARNSDPDTSKAAAELDMTKMERAVYDVIRRRSPTGICQDDLLDAFPPEKSQSVTPRVRRLIEKGYVEETGETREGLSGRLQRVVRATSKEMPE